jgi:hypothetical protein
MCWQQLGLAVWLVLVTAGIDAAPTQESAFSGYDMHDRRTKPADRMHGGHGPVAGLGGRRS